MKWPLPPALHQTTAKASIVIDADVQYPPELIRDFVDKWKERYRVVYGACEKTSAARCARSIARCARAVLAHAFGLVSREGVSRGTCLPLSCLIIYEFTEPFKKSRHPLHEEFP
jgi:hypothetical protein